MAGSGVQLPSDAHTAVIFPAGTNPGLHPNTILVPADVFLYVPMEPFVGTVGSPQLAGRKEINCSSTKAVI